MVRELSLGERMKMELIAALIHRPRVLFLDEPTIGLDVVSQRAVRLFLRDYNRRHRVTIILTSHYMADIKELCERVIVIHKGSKIYDGGARPAGIRDRAAGRRSSGSSQRIPRSARRGARASARPAAPMTGPSPCACRATTSSPWPRRCSRAGPVADITIEDVPLEDVIAELFQST